MRNQICKSLLFLGIVATAGCRSKQPEPLFTELGSANTGINFINRIPDTAATTILDYLYYYNGGGVAVGDFNNDSLADVYFVSNTASNKLYINEGAMRFRDITNDAGVEGSGNWKTGVTLVDINADGYLDIYLSCVGGYRDFKGQNELFINDGNLRFNEQASEYGLAIEGFNTQSEFFDYDLDGDLDMFLVNHSVHSSEVFQSASVRNKYSRESGDKLFRNDRTPEGVKFTEVSSEAGIYSSAVGYGLNVSVADINRDGWPDIYVTNDFHENDYYYLNNKNGTFAEINQSAFLHESRFSMGSDIADLNNDGWPDIITLDMLADNEKILKSSAGEDSWETFNLKYKLGYHYQLSRNCLQLNTGDGMRFSEIGLYAGIAATDWSWAPLAADFDNDGIKDIFITNGILRRPNDLDFIKFNSAATQRLDNQSIISHMPDGAGSNYFFKGMKNLQFVDKSYSSGLRHKGYSSGSAAADLDNDGDLDLVISNINDLATVYRNNTEKTDFNFFQVQLKGDSQNRFALGAEITISTKPGRQYMYVNSSKGFLSSSLQSLHFGTGHDEVIDEVLVRWSNGKRQSFKHVAANQRFYVSYQEPMALTVPSTVTVSLLNDITADVRLAYRHVEDGFNDFANQPFNPRLLSRQGPALAISDVNGDRREDIFVGGAKNQCAELFLQGPDNLFKASGESVFAKQLEFDDVDALFFDADVDGDQDLYVVTGGNEKATSPDRLYVNDGSGHFREVDLPVLSGTKSVVVSADFNHDYLPDLFVGGRALPGDYGQTPTSYLLINQGKARFTVASDCYAPGLSTLGMVTDAAWIDLDHDTWLDLVVVGEWIPVTIYKNNKGKLADFTQDAGMSATSGLWQHIEISDVNSDGFDDLVVGNLGTNSKLSASEKKPLHLYLINDHASKKQPVIAYNKDDSYYPLLHKEDIERQFPLLRKKFPYYADFAGLSVNQIFPQEISSVQPLKANMLSTSLFLNNQKGQFLATSLPSQVQYGPVCASFTKDLDNNGTADIMFAGNLYGATPQEGRYDALWPTILLGSSENRSKFIAPSTLQIDGEVRHIKIITLANNLQAIVLAINDQPLRFLSIQNHIARK